MCESLLKNLCSDVKCEVAREKETSQRKTFFNPIYIHLIQALIIHTNTSCGTKIRNLYNNDDDEKWCIIMFDSILFILYIFLYFAMRFLIQRTPTYLPFLHTEKRCKFLLRDEETEREKQREFACLPI